MAVPLTDSIVSPAVARALRAWAVAQNIERIHRGTCRKWGTWRERDCFGCIRTQSRTQDAAGDVYAARRRTGS